MPNIVMTKLKNQPTEKTDKLKIFAFLTKLAEDDTTVGLHIEKMVNSVDSRARTARVDQGLRAVLYRLEAHGNEPTYVYAGTWQHDEAIRRAQTLKVNLNSVNGAVELIGVGASNAAPDMRPDIDHQHGSAAVPSFLTVSYNYTAADLVSLLGFDALTADLLIGATGEDELLDLVDGLENEWQRTAALGLAVGDAVDKILSDIGAERPSAQAAVDDESILQGLSRPASKMQFTFVENDEDLRSIIDDGDFGAWRVFLHPEQERYATGHWNGPFRLTGGAGTGKTVVLLHRARTLALQKAQARIVLTTFTRALGDNLSRDLGRLDPNLVVADGLGGAGILIRGLDQLAVAVKDRAGPAFGVSAATVFGVSIELPTSIRANDAGWADAIADAAPDLHAAELTESFFLGEYLQVILPSRITTRAQYFAVRRPGRGVALDRRKRDEVWRVVDRYRRDARLRGVVSWAEVSAIATAWLEQHGEAAGVLADHILVDEAQDLIPTHWQFLRALARPGRDDLFIAEDSHQRIYSRHVVLSRYGIAITGRARRLTLNYRTTAENLRYALAVLEGVEYIDPEEGIEGVLGYRSPRRGPQPEVRAAKTHSDQFDVVAALVSQWIDAGVEPSSIAILARVNAAAVRDALAQRDLATRLVKNASAGGGEPLVLTMHTSKGMEFSRVVLFDVSEGVVPLPAAVDGVAPADLPDALLRERSLLYVAASRARDVLVVTWRGRPSPLLSGA